MTFQDRILRECWPRPQEGGGGGQERGADAGDAEVEVAAPAARAADLATPAPCDAEPSVEGQWPPRAGAAGQTGGGCASWEGGTYGMA